MNPDRLRVAFAGTPEFAAVALAALIASEHELVGVLTQPDRRAGRGRQLQAGPVKELARTHGIEVQQPSSLRDATAQAELARLRPDVLVVAAYGLLLPAAVLSLPVLGCLNIHASLLPRWRGAAPIHRAIMAGDTESGITIMQMDQGLDTGAMLHRVELSIGSDETTGELHDRLAGAGADALLTALPLRAMHRQVPVVQPDTGVTYAAKVDKSEAPLDLACPAIELHRQVRAFNPWPVAEATLDDVRLRVWRSRLVAGPDGQAGRGVAARPGTVLAVLPDAIRVATGHGELDLLELQRPGKRPMPAALFAQGAELTGRVFAVSGKAHGHS